MMVIIALIGVMLGLVVTVRTNRARRNYLGWAKQFAESEKLEREMQKLHLLEAELEDKKRALAARRAWTKLELLRTLRNRTRYAARYPGSTGGYDDPVDSALDELTRSHFERAIRRVQSIDKWAAEHRSDAARSAQRATHFLALKLKYERAAARPWLPVEPDPPPPE
jgi:hypothetical protein